MLVNLTNLPLEDQWRQEITITVGTPGGVVGDMNDDGEVNFLDISPFIAVLSVGGFQDAADIDRNGSVNFLDITPFTQILNGQ